jgi:hypothetical protein
MIALITKIFEMLIMSVMSLLTEFFFSIHGGLDGGKGFDIVPVLYASVLFVISIQTLILIIVVVPCWTLKLH